MPNTQLLIIDAQNDFCDYSTEAYVPALPVPGAYQDCLRLAQLINQVGSGIGGVLATLDSHHMIDLAHNTSWLTEQGTAPPPFSLVTTANFIARRYRLAAAEVTSEQNDYVLNYLQQLEQMQRPFILWPPHCLIGTQGHNLNAELAQALSDWETRTSKPVTFVQKGENIWTESFSALKAVIPDPTDQATQLNLAVLEMLARSDRLLIAGQASSHCVKETINDILQFGAAGLKHKLVILTDCMSPVSGFEAAVEQFFTELRAQGIRLATSAEIALELVPANTQY
ncbi:isochorismatase family protein [Methylomonas rosea]|uniref:Isochorismatase family protein n=1 Tax=Methylomonas rosea TaxID=2952227 RepID=A0ABT1TUA0_9GAMM|nr:isochorismatase family protein [Methylomonas sp. WSC-7]MCQ8117931.1 isochorismatase family protein [Methylomonas sp. WSC-7]